MEPGHPTGSEKSGHYFQEVPEDLEAEGVWSSMDSMRKSGRTSHIEANDDLSILLD
jgi:hypothetical protein